MNDSSFESLADRLLDRLEEALGEHGDAERQGGVLTIETAAGTWLINKHAPMRQIWLSSPSSGARHFAFDAQSGHWQDTRGGSHLLALLSAELGISLPSDRP